MANRSAYASSTPTGSRSILPQPYSVPDRLFDGIFILPRHKLEAAWKQGKLADAWPLSTPPAEIAGPGAFRLKEYVAGQRITLERNPYYWKVGLRRARSCRT